MRGGPAAFTALARCFVSGARDMPLTLYRTPRLRCIGIRLRPCAIAAILEDSPSVLQGQLATAAGCLGPRLEACLERVHGAPARTASAARPLPSPAQRAVEQYLVLQLCQTDLDDRLPRREERALRIQQIQETRDARLEAHLRQA